VKYCEVRRRIGDTMIDKKNHGDLSMKLNVNLLERCPNGILAKESNDGKR